MPNTTTLNETVRTLDGTEWIRLATPGANWRAQVSAIETFFQAPLTSANDTNVTITLGGSPSICLLNATSITLGWAGTLAAGRLNANVVQSVVNDTNVTGSIASQALTLGWTGTLAVGRGGTGVGTLALNGVLYGNAASAVNVTAASGANMVLWANSGAPSFTATPVIGTSVTCPLYIGGTASSSTLQLESTSGAGLTDSIQFLTGSQVEAGRIDANQRTNFGNKGAQAANFLGNNPLFQLTHLTGSDTFDCRRYSADANGLIWTTLKSRGATIGTATALSSGDALWTVDIGGYDATGTPVARIGAAIQAIVDAAPTAGSLPTRLAFGVCQAGAGSAGSVLLLDSSSRINILGCALTSTYASGANNSTIDLGPGSNTNVANGANVSICPGFRAMAFVTEESGGTVALYLLTSGGSSLVSTTATTWVSPTTTPAAGRCSVNWDGASTFKIYNNIGAAVNFRWFTVKLL
jgi:hypothetical protein